MVSALLSRPRLAHSNPSRTLIGTLLSANPNNESSHHPTIDTAAGTHASRRTYVPINPESASGPHNRRGDTAHVWGNYRRRSWQAIWKERQVRRRVITLIISTIFLILVLGLCKAIYHSVEFPSRLTGSQTWHLQSPAHLWKKNSTFF